MQEIGYARLQRSPPSPRPVAFSASEAEMCRELYETLGGKLEAPAIAPGGWDLSFDGGLVVELDEELHFNRYRGLTLAPSWTASLPWRERYLAYAVDFEAQCLRAGRWGSRWTSKSSERMMGNGDAPGALANGGAPRWKQRALYDAVKDVAANAGQVRLARLSVHDDVGEVRLGLALEGRANLDLVMLSSLIQSRTCE
jgi:hypothetical protein